MLRSRNTTLRQPDEQRRQERCLCQEEAGGAVHGCETRLWCSAQPRPPPARLPRRPNRQPRDTPFALYRFISEIGSPFTKESSLRTYTSNVPVERPV